MDIEKFTLPELPEKKPKKQRRCASCPRLFVGLLSAFLTGLVMFQVVTNILGAISLGEKYKKPAMIIYKVFSLLPALAIGGHLITTYLFKRDVQFLRTFSKVSSIIYVVIFELLWIFWLFACCPQIIQQNTWQHLSSFQSAMHFYIYYYGVSMYAPAWLLSLP